LAAKVVRAAEAPTTEMRLKRGVQHRFVGPETGSRRLDVHLNVIHADSGIGPYHLHREAENVYVILDGVAEAIVDGRRFELYPGDVAFIPPGVPHAAGSAGSGPVKVLEIYAPAGQDFHVLDDPRDIVDERGGT
jgi:mannose-6-phosphate isomerase-like protein (cupin superfamily)